MLADVTGNALEFECHIPDFLGFLVIGQEVTEDFFLLVGLGQGHAYFEGDHLRQLVRQAIGLALHPRHVTHHRLRGHGAKGDDLRYRLAAIGIRHIVDNPVTPFHAEVDVKVGHGNPFRIQEALEQQVILQRIQISNQQRIGHQRARPRTPARPDRYAVVLGPLDEVHDDQEVTGKLHLDDDIQFEVEPINVDLPAGLVILRTRRQDYLETLFQPLEGDLAKEVRLTHAIRCRKGWQKVLAQLHVDIATLGNLDTVGQSLRNIGKQLGHFLRTFQVLLITVLTNPAWIIKGPAFANTDAGFVGFKILAFEKTYIVGGHHRATTLARQCHGGMQILLVIQTTGALKLKIKTAREDTHPVIQQLSSQLRITRQQSQADFTFLGAGQGNHILARLGDPLAANGHQTVTLTFGITPGDQFGQIAIAITVHRQQGHTGKLGIVITAQQPQIDTGNRLDTTTHGRLVELHQTAHVVLIGHRHSRHPRLSHRFDQRLDLDNAVNQRELAVYAQVNKGMRHGGPVSEGNN